MRTPPCRSAVVFLAGIFLLRLAPVVMAQSADVPAVDAADRDAVIDLYRNYYLPSNGILPGWNGSVADGQPGALSQDYLTATVRRINYFRAMSGLLGNVVFDPACNGICQEAALMLAAQRDVSHTPPSNWKFYTPSAATACGGSDIRVDWDGDEGPGAIDRYIADAESNNVYVGHRRWLLYAGQSTMATGAVPAAGADHAGANATWILGPFVPRPDDAPSQTSWPPAGYVPADLIYARWSFSYLGADFTRASVTMEKNGAALRVTPETVAFQSNSDGDGSSFVGDNTLVWEAPDNAVSLAGGETYTVHLSNVFIDGEARSFDYTVTSVDVAHAGDTPPMVFVRPKRPAVTRASGARGKFRLTRQGSRKEALTVNYTVSGSAAPGMEYAPLSGTATIAAGAAGVTVKVLPTPDVPDADDSTVTIILQPGPGYRVGSDAGATITLTTEDQ